MRFIESLLVKQGMGRGSSRSSLDLETLESDVSSGKSAGSIANRPWVAKHAVFVNVLRQSSEETRRHVMSVGADGV